MQGLQALIPIIILKIEIVLLINIHLLLTL